MLHARRFSPGGRCATLKIENADEIPRGGLASSLYPRSRGKIDLLPCSADEIRA